MQRDKSPGGSRRTSRHPRGPDGKAAGIVPGASEVIQIELVGGPLDGERLSVEKGCPPTLRLPWKTRRGKNPFLEVKIDPAGPDLVVLEYRLDRVACEGTAAFFRYAGRTDG